ncbi:SubName: Full=Uncharacterized protein {ECO:0000313/EMBL:CCA74319.1} [Serendipita indica DSM 11827]|nr:SubName: Full=Uncharacterized protein {ECO:0000313/EMBL:CCA74319.1} [Serendipita indica DSM 11827]
MAAVRRSAIGPITHSLEWPPLPASTLSRVFEPTTVAAASHIRTYDYWSPGGCLPQTVHSPASDSGSGSSGATTPLADYYYQQQQQQQQQQQAFHPQPHIMLQDEEDDFSPPNSVGSSQHSTPALGAIPLPTAPLSDKHQAILSSFKSPNTDIPNTTVPPRSENERYHCTECSKTLLGFDAETRHKAWHHLQERRRRIQRHESQEHKSDTSPQPGHKSYVACNFCRSMGSAKTDQEVTIAPHTPLDGDNGLNSNSINYRQHPSKYPAQHGSVELHEARNYPHLDHQSTEFSNDSSLAAFSATRLTGALPVRHEQLPELSLSATSPVNIAEDIEQWARGVPISAEEMDGGHGEANEMSS